MCDMVVFLLLLMLLQGLSFILSARTFESGNGGGGGGEVSVSAS